MAFGSVSFGDAPFGEGGSPLAPALPGSGTPAFSLPDGYPLAHLSAQFGLAWDGSFNFLTQDTDDEVSQCVEMVCGTRQGQRTVTPKFGLPDATFTDPNPNLITTAIQQWEPRAVAKVGVTYATDGTASMTVSVTQSRGGNQL